MVRAENLLVDVPVANRPKDPWVHSRAVNPLSPVTEWLHDLTAPLELACGRHPLKPGYEDGGPVADRTTRVGPDEPALHTRIEIRTARPETAADREDGGSTFP